MLTERAALLDRFVAGTRWRDAVRVPLAGDASSRRYERCTLTDTGETCVLMDAPPDRGESVVPFVRIARHLLQAGFSAPEILAEDIGHGFLLIEDFGDGVFARLIDAERRLEGGLYDASVDVLAALQSAPVPDDLVRFTPALMAEQASLVLETYGNLPGQVEGFRGALETVLGSDAFAPQVLILRDYHAENLIWLPDRKGIARVGLLDFQDAMVGPVGYDLVSLIHDARRDVPRDLAERLVARFVQTTALDAQQFESTRAVLSAQRNLRILGIFARLARDHGKTGYLPLIPRVWGHLSAAMAHPALVPLRPYIDELSAPTSAHLTSLGK